MISFIHFYIFIVCMFQGSKMCPLEKKTIVGSVFPSQTARTRISNPVSTGQCRLIQITILSRIFWSSFACMCTNVLLFRIALSLFASLFRAIKEVIKYMDEERSLWGGGGVERRGDRKDEINCETQCEKIKVSCSQRKCEATKVQIQRNSNLKQQYIEDT